jgi:hypothetical protein
MKQIKVAILSALLIIPFVLTGCLIEEVDQPSSVKTGDVFTANITITDMNAEQNNAHKGVIAVLVPEDWTFIDGSYNTTMGVGIMEQDSTTPPVWGDVDTVIERPEGMKWINLTSDIGYMHDKNMVYEAKINLKVGQKTGKYNIGYLTTVNTTDMLKFLNDQDVDQDLSGTDTSMYHPVTITGATSVIENKLGGVPSQYKLEQNYPNPFNPSTTIRYSVPEGSNVKITVYDVSGKEVRILADGYKSAGNYALSFSAGDLSSGIYYYRIITNRFTQTNKMLLLK